MKRLIALFPFFLVVIGCSQGPASTDASVITARSAAWDAALNAGDIDAIVALYTDDARVLPPNREMIVGADGVRAEFGGMIDAGLSVKLTPIETTVSGSFGYNVGTYVLSAGDTTVDVALMLTLPIWFG